MGREGEREGSANIGVPQRSPLSPVVILFWIAPILKRMEERVREGVKVDVEMPSIVDDMCSDIIDWEGNINMQQIETGVKGLLREVAEECRLPLEVEKEEILYLRKSRKKKNAEVC